MAEIKIEKKSLPWLWIIIGLIIVGLLLYFLFFRNNDNNSIAEDDRIPTNTVNTTTADKATDDPVSQYVAYINNDRMMTLDHAYTNGALLHLVKAIQMKAEQVGYNVRADLDRVESIANAITKDPMTTTHADSIHDAATILHTVMANMQQAKFPGLQNEMAEVKEAATSIDPSVQTLNQKPAVKSFFDKSAQLLQRMN